MYEIYDEHNEKRDLAWLHGKYGNVEVQEADASDGADVYRLIEIREKVGPAALVATVLDKSGAPQDRAIVIRYWPDAPELPQWDPPPERWTDRGVKGKTDINGAVGFGIGKGDYYDPAKEQGASALWVGEPGAHTDCIRGLGMLPGTNHAHLDATFQRADGGGPPPTPPPVEGNELARIATALETIAAFFSR